MYNVFKVAVMLLSSMSAPVFCTRYSAGHHYSSPVSSGPGDCSISSGPGDSGAFLRNWMPDDESSSVHAVSTLQRWRSATFGTTVSESPQIPSNASHSHRRSHGHSYGNSSAFDNHDTTLHKLYRLDQSIEALSLEPAQQCFPKPNASSRAASLGAMPGSKQEFLMPKRGHCEFPYASLQFGQPQTNNSEQLCTGPFSSQPTESRRVAVVLAGEAFRMSDALAGLGDRRLSGSGAAFKAQKAASQSHVDFIIHPFEDCGFTVDVFLASYETSEGTDDLISWYGSRVVKSSFIPHSEGNQSSTYKRALELVVGSYQESQGSIAYDAMIVTRFDLKFKAIPMPTAEAALNKTMFMFHMWEICGGRRDFEGQRAVDTLYYFPWKHFNCALEWGFLEHESLNFLANWFRAESPDIPVDDQLGFLFPKEFHDTNSKDDWNPVYNMIRPAEVLDLHGGVASVLVGVKENQDVCSDCAGSVLGNAHYHSEPEFVGEANGADFFIHSWSPNSKDFYTDNVPDKFQTFMFESLADNATAAGFSAWGRSTLRALTAMRQQELQESEEGFCHRPAVDYDLVLIFRDDVVLQCVHNAAWYQVKIPLCQGWKHDCSEQEPIVGVGFGGLSDVEFSAVPTVLVTNSFGARRIASELAKLTQADGPWPSEQAAEGEVMTWLLQSFGMPVRQVCRHC